jgi:hypothetical protein
MKDHDLEAIAQALVKEGKGILAADESFGTIAKRFKKIGVESTEENRRRYREMLFTTAGMEAYISGVILFDETIHQKTRDGVPFPQLLQSKGVVPGIKVDLGKVDIPFFPGEQVTIGLDGLGDRAGPGAHGGAIPTSRPGAYRRARGFDGRRSQHRHLRSSDDRDAHHVVPGAKPGPHQTGGQPVKAQYGAAG